MQYFEIKVKILERFQHQADFAMVLGESESKVSRVIRGRRKLSREEAKRWSRILKCEADVFKPVLQET